MCDDRWIEGSNEVTCSITTSLSSTHTAKISRQLPAHQSFASGFSRKEDNGQYGEE